MVSAVDPLGRTRLGSLIGHQEEEEDEGVSLGNEVTPYNYCRFALSR